MQNMKIVVPLIWDETALIILPNGVLDSAKSKFPP